MAQIVSVVREDGFVKICTENGAAIHYPLELLPTLFAASPEQFNDHQVFGRRIFWNQICFSLLCVETSST